MWCPWQPTSKATVICKKMVTNSSAQFLVSKAWKTITPQHTWSAIMALVAKAAMVRDIGNKTCGGHWM